MRVYQQRHSDDDQTITTYKAVEQWSGTLQDTQVPKDDEGELTKPPA